MIASEIIIATVTKDKVRDMYIYSNELFGEDSYKKLLGYGLGFAHGTMDTIHIGMSDFNPTSDIDVTKNVRLAFQDRSETILPFAFERSIFDLVQE